MDLRHRLAGKFAKKGEKMAKKQIFKAPMSKKPPYFYSKSKEIFIFYHLILLKDVTEPKSLKKAKTTICK